MAELFDRCESCRRILWEPIIWAKLVDRKEPVKLCTECFQVYDLFGRIEMKLTEEKQDGTGGT